MDNKKYIFLDFDGVVTSCLERPGSYIVNADDGYGASPSCLARLLRLVDETGAAVVVASNWRRFAESGKCSFWSSPGRGAYSNPLPALKKALGARWAGDLPPIRHARKPEALAMWFAENGLNPESTRYVVFDDDSSEGYADSQFRDHFIMTDCRTGLTEKDCEKAKEVLKA